MKILQQIDESGYRIGQIEADIDPLDAGKFLIPAGAIEAAAPPPMLDTQRAHWTGAAWEVQDKPVPPPPPPPYMPTRAETITARLHQIDTDSARSLRAVVTATAAGKPAPAFDSAKLAALETEAAALRAELAALPK